VAWDRDIGDEPPASFRDRAPDPLAQIDPFAPIGGHHVPDQGGPSIHDAPEQDWSAAASRLLPLLRPAGMSGTPLDGVAGRHVGTEGLRSHALPVIDKGPAGLTIAYAIRAGGFDVLVNPDHLLAWGVTAEALRAAAMENLGLWSGAATWTDEADGHRRIMSSDTGEGADAARILLAEVRRHLTEQLGDGSRVLIGLPERHLLVAASLHPDDPEFATMLAEFITINTDGADEPIDGRVLELVGDELRAFVP
jgi:hypothetical protein